MRLSEIRQNPTIAHVAPLAIFMLLSSVPGYFRIENSGLPWHVQQPEHWWYPVQTLICGALLWWWKDQYRLAPWKPAHLLWASAAGALGIAIWVLPGWLFQSWEVTDPPSWWKWFGLADRSEGFDPSLLDEHPEGKAASLIMRFARSSVVVPFVEELCWRGWLMRYAIAGERSFTRIPFGTHRWKSYLIVTVCVTIVHAPEDWIAAFIWGTLVYFVAVKTKSLGACVVMHAVGNLLLGLYILKTQQWGYW